MLEVALEGVEAAGKFFANRALAAKLGDTGDSSEGPTHT